jgi:hypothetical protein
VLTIYEERSVGRETCRCKERRDKRQETGSHFTIRCEGLTGFTPECIVDPCGRDLCMVLPSPIFNREESKTFSLLYHGRAFVSVNRIGDNVIPCWHSRHG